MSAGNALRQAVRAGLWLGLMACVTWGRPLSASETGGAVDVQAQAQAAEAPDEAAPAPLEEEVFEGLMSSSPFTRSLGVSDSLILTGIAWHGNEVYATLLDTKTQGSQVVSQTPNGAGWRLLEVGGDPERLQTWTARIQIPGGETVAIRYQPPPPPAKRSGSGSRGSGGSSGSAGSGSTELSSAQRDEAKKAAVNYKEGFSGDGYPRQPPPETVAKLSRLSTDQREEINQRMMEMRNRGLSMDDRRRIYESMVDRASQGRR
jgi:hypothetical protein